MLNCVKTHKLAFILCIIPVRFTQSLLSIFFLHCLSMEEPREVNEWILVTLATFTLVSTLLKTFTG